MNRLTKRQREAFIGYLFIFIWIVGFGIFTIFPVVQSFIYSLSTVRITAEGLEIVDRVGFDNYQNAFVYIYFVEAIWNYIKNMVITIPSIIFFSVIIGLLLNTDIKGRGIYRTIFFLPVIISSGPVLMKIQSEGALVIPMLSSNELINLIQAGLPTFLSDGIQAIFAKIILIMWFTGVPIIIIIAGLQKIDKSIYEAAAIDGASGWESFWKITLPSLKPLINVITVFSMMSISLFSSNQVFEIINSRRLTQFGLSNAFSWIYFGVTLILLVLFLTIININFKRKPKTKKKVVNKHA
ncbi:carbohydrate ABC transporter permease [Candidatus Izemoplasma sp. B36]|uniref:carbohydrate ABC transporter permease n=1 Tax=Candidatus Izemoplasma sp. B36 TaxID=3242468 RepID=UPI003558396A